jgi:hypothetical protein
MGSEGQASLFGDADEPTTSAQRRDTNGARQARRGMAHGESVPESGSDLPPEAQPLAARMRPRTLDDVVGQAHLVGPGRALRRTIESDNP